MATLAGLGEVARRLNDQPSAEEALAARDRVEAEQFYVACVGQFKRGKSTLLDALIGDQVLPAGVTPVTAVPTVIRQGSERTARVQEATGMWRTIPVERLADFVAEEHNPGNAKGIRAAEVLEPSPLLADGLCLVDTPGLGSVFDANTQSTLAFVPHIDVMLVVIGTDPPLAGDELRLIETASQHANDVLVVLNKADRASEAERKEAVAFARRLIEDRLARPIARIFEVSAKEQLDGVRVWPDWQALVTSLLVLASQSGASVSLTAGRRATARIGKALRARIADLRRALTAPAEESEARMRHLRASVEEATRKLDDLSPVLAAQEQKLVEGFRDVTREFLSRTRAPAHAQLATRLDALNQSYGPTVRQHAMAAAQDVTREVIAVWLPQVQKRSDEVFQTSMQRFVESVSDTWRAASDDGDAAMHTLPSMDEIIAVVSSQSRFRFNEQITLARPASPLLHLADVALGALGLRRLFLARAHRFLDWLLELNVARVESDLADRMHNARKALERKLRDTLLQARARDEEALDRAKRIRQAGATAVADELSRLDELERDLLRIGANWHVAT